ncbi:MAG: type II secretion system GspH family protein [Myxococcales bacterium]|nr:type II secretion system GspH family protein [Myxococcales bacterium]
MEDRHARHQGVASKRTALQQRTRLLRERRRRQGMTLIEIMIVMVIMALVATAAGFAIIPQLNKAKIKQTSTDAKAVASAAELYLAEHDDCPTVQDLVSEKILDKKKNVQDAWKNDFTIECDEDGATVRSAGPDEQMGTEDDIE